VHFVLFLFRSYNNSLSFLIPFARTTLCELQHAYYVHFSTRASPKKQQNTPQVLFEGYFVGALMILRGFTASFAGHVGAFLTARWSLRLVKHTCKPKAWRAVKNRPYEGRNNAF